MDIDAAEKLVLEFLKSEPNTFFAPSVLTERMKDVCDPYMVKMAALNLVGDGRALMNTSWECGLNSQAQKNTTTP